MRSRLPFRSRLLQLAALVAGPHLFAGGALAQFEWQSFEGFNSDEALGTAVAIGGQVFVVGDPETAGGGTVYAYRVESGSIVFEQKLAGSDVSGGGYFGGDVAVSGDAILVGASQHKTSGLTGAGAAYVFRRVAGSWTLEIELVAPTPMGSDAFGSDVAIAGDVAVVGALGVNGPNTTTGAAFVFRRVRGVWGLEQTLVPTDPATGSKYFGEAVALDGSGTTLAVGADLGILLGGWGDCPTADGKLPCIADLDGDGAVTGADLGLLLGAWGTANSPPSCNSGANASCCVAHGSPGCHDSLCCNAICASDPFCCESFWDAICVNAAQSACGCPPPPGCGDPNAGDCCLPSQVIPGSPGCNDAACCELVCDFIDPFCCDVEWDASCATGALQFCQPCPPIHCGLSAGDCCDEALPLVVGCNDPVCCTFICAMDPFCCEIGWDGVCVAQAFEYCAGCGGTPPP